MAVPGVLFVYHTWDEDERGLAGFHRDSIEGFIKKKKKEGENLKVYSTILDVTVTPEQKRDADSLGVTLITAERDKRMKPKRHPINPESLMLHKSYYPSLQDLENIQYVVGYAPLTADAAAIIREGLFPEAQLYFINHLYPEDPYLLMSDEDRNELARDMLRMASEADAVFSIGPSIKEYFDNAYRANYEDKDLSRLPHLEIIPKLRKKLFGKDLKSPSEKINRHVILTYGHIDSRRASLIKYVPVAASIDTVAKARKQVHTKQTALKIQGVPQQHHAKVLKNLDQNMRSGILKPTLCPGYSAKELITNLQQSHLCVIAPCHDNYGMNGLEAMAAGIPSLIQDDTQIAALITKYFIYHKNDCIVRNPGDQWQDKIMDIIENTGVAFRKANELKTAFMKSKKVKKSHSRFARFFTSKPAEDQVTGTPLEDRTNLPVNLQLNDNQVEEQDSLTTNEEHAIQDQSPGASTGVNSKVRKYKKKLKRKAREVMNDKEESLHVAKVVKTTVGRGVDVSGMSEGSLTLLLNLPSLFYLYRLQACCRSGLLAHKLEPLLITDEMREEAALDGIPLQLKATYDEEKFAAVDNFLLKMGDANVEDISDDEEEESDEEKTEQEEFSSVDVGLAGYQSADVSQAVKGKRSQFLYIKVNPKMETKDSTIIRYITMIHGAKSCIRLRGQHSNIIQADVEMSEKIQHILHSKSEILRLMGIQSYLWSDMKSMYSTISELEEQIMKHGTSTATLRKSSTSSLSMRSLLPLPSQSKLYPKLVQNVLGTVHRLQSESQLLKYKLDESEHEKAVLVEQNKTLTKQSEIAENRVVQQLIDNSDHIHTIESLKGEHKEKDLHISDVESKLSKLQLKLTQYKELIPQELHPKLEVEDLESTSTTQREKEKGPGDADIPETSTDTEMVQKPTHDELKKPIPEDSEDIQGKEQKEKRDSVGIVTKVRRFFAGGPEENERKRLQQKEKRRLKDLKIGQWKLTERLNGQSGPVKFKRVQGMTTNHLGQVVMADEGNNSVLTLKSTYEVDSEIRFDGHFPNKFKPYDVAVTTSNTYFMTDSGNDQVIMFDKSSKTTKTFCQNDDITPRAIALLDEGFVVTDDKGHRVVKYDMNGESVAEVGRHVQPSLLYNPQFVVVNSDNNVIVSDQGRSYNEDGSIKVFGKQLQYLFTMCSDVWAPYGLSVDLWDNVYNIQVPRESGYGLIVKYTKNGEEVERFRDDLHLGRLIAVSKYGQPKIIVSDYNRVIVYTK